MRDAPSKPGLKRHGYWDHPDPEHEIHRLLRGRKDLLESFAQALEREDDAGGCVADWVEENEDLPDEVKACVERAYDGESEAFDEVEIGRSWGEGFDGRLTAMRRGGLIHYRSRGEDPLEVPRPTRGPLALEVIGDVLLTDREGLVDDLAELDEDDPDALDGAVAGVDAWSEFYDLARAQAARSATAVERVREARAKPATARSKGGGASATTTSRGPRAKRRTRP